MRRKTWLWLLAFAALVGIGCDEAAIPTVAEAEPEPQPAPALHLVAILVDDGTQRALGELRLQLPDLRVSCAPVRIVLGEGDNDPMVVYRCTAEEPL